MAVPHHGQKRASAGEALRQVGQPSSGRSRREAMAEQIPPRRPAVTPEGDYVWAGTEAGTPASSWANTRIPWLVGRAEETTTATPSVPTRCSASFTTTMSPSGR